jgi:hypothetical protein
MLSLRFANRFVDPQPIAHKVDLTEGHTRLSHAPRAGIHAQQDDFFAPAAITLKVPRVWFPRVVKRVVDVGDGFGESEAMHLTAQSVRNGR